MSNIQEPLYEPAPRKGLNPWLIALIVVLVLAVVCCCCVVIGVLFLSPQIGNVFSTVIEEIMTATPIP